MKYENVRGHRAAAGSWSLISIHFRHRRHGKQPPSHVISLDLDFIFLIFLLCRTCVVIINNNIKDPQRKSIQKNRPSKFSAWWSPLIGGLMVRYLAVVFPVSSKTLRTNHNTGLALGLAWALSLLLSCPAIFLHGLIGSRAVEEQVQSLASRGQPPLAFLITFTFTGNFLIVFRCSLTIAAIGQYCLPTGETHVIFLKPEQFSVVDLHKFYGDNRQWSCKMSKWKP